MHMINKPLQIEKFNCYLIKYNNVMAEGEGGDMCYLIVSDVWPHNLSLQFPSKFTKYCIIKLAQSILHLCLQYSMKSKKGHYFHTCPYSKSLIWVRLALVVMLNVVDMYT